MLCLTTETVTGRKLSTRNSKAKVTISQGVPRLLTSPSLITFHFEAILVSLLEVSLAQICLGLAS